MDAARRHRVAGLLGIVAAAWGASMLLGHWNVQRLGEQVATRAAPGDIVMLSSVTCAYCKDAREWFGAHRVPFSECMIERDAACAAMYRTLLAPGTPVLVVRGRRQVGFDPARVAAALEAAPAS
jgi:arsenate reductase-like glutaredoxin family protein